MTNSFSFQVRRASVKGGPLQSLYIAFAYKHLSTDTFYFFIGNRQYLLHSEEALNEHLPVLLNCYIGLRLRQYAHKLLLMNLCETSCEMDRWGSKSLNSSYLENAAINTASYDDCAASDDRLDNTHHILEVVVRPQ